MQLNSLFDSFLTDDSSYKAFWKKNLDIKVGQVENGVSTCFYKTGKKMKWAVKRYYFISDENLYYSNSNNKAANLKGFALLSTTILLGNEQIGQNYFFHLKRGNHIIKLFTKNESEYTKWTKILKGKCILLNFPLDFELVMVLGKGAFAEVYSARNKHTKHVYAAKCFSKKAIQKERKGKDGLMNEIEIMLKLNHPRIVNLHHIYEDEDYVYLIMDYIKGGELLKRIDFLDEFSEYELRLLMKNLFDIVKYIHTKGIIHRDIKLDNILLKSEETLSDIVLADFGLATFLTQTKNVYKRCGTPGFVAPEIINYKEGKPFYNEKADVFSCGIVMHILITGTKVFTSTKIKEVLALNKECEINWDSVIYDGLSEDSISILKDLLMKDPIERISANDALEHPFIKDMDKNTHRNNLKKNLPYIEIARLSITKSIDQNSGGYSPLVMKNLGARSRRYSNNSNNSNNSNYSNNSRHSKNRSRQNSPHI